MTNEEKKNICDSLRKYYAERFQEETKLDDNQLLKIYYGRRYWNEMVEEAFNKRKKIPLKSDEEPKQEKQIEGLCSVGQYTTEIVTTKYYKVILGGTHYRYTKDELMQLRNMLNQALES